MSNTVINEKEINFVETPEDDNIDIKAVLTALIRGHKQIISLLEKLLDT